MFGADTALIALVLLVQGPGVDRDARGLASQQNALVGADGLMLAAGTYVAADDLRDQLDEHWLTDEPSSITDVYGSSRYNLPASLSLWTLGRATGNAGLRETGAELTRTLTLTQLAVGPVKLVTRRKRPDGSNRLSFPSGHTANAFAVARLIQRKYDMPLALPLYILGGFTGAGRVAGGHHYMSDVVMGAAVGIIVGSSVCIGDADASSNAGMDRLSVIPRIAPGGGFLHLAVSW